MRSWFNQWGDREVLWVMIGLFGLIVFALSSNS